MHPLSILVCVYCEPAQIIGRSKSERKREREKTKTNFLLDFVGQPHLVRKEIVEKIL